MRGFSDYNPIVVALYCLSVAGIAMFCMHPILLSLSLLGALLFYFVQSGGIKGPSHLYFLALFLGLILLNPILSHNGVTVLFVVNDYPITLEAMVYGALTGGMILAVLYWFRSFTEMMTDDKLLYLFGKLSPKLALILSMALRYVPLFARQQKKIHQTQTALGLYKEDNLIDRLRGGLRIFSVMVTWALENGITTADSMTARGYGMGRRTHYSDFRFQKADALLLSLIVALTALTATSILWGAMEFEVYPAIRFGETSVYTVIGYLSYGSLVLLPTIMEGKERIKWNYFVSKI